mmetsp:Transcript_10289/g.30110  ORF Transcript_10289/g.30110 Transcript_10289/m.30110 type:complete len:244 (-) Transcript_10289:248-979(-)
MRATPARSPRERTIQRAPCRAKCNATTYEKSLLHTISHCGELRLEQLPDDGEERRLQRVGEQPRAQAPREQPRDAVHRHDVPRRLEVGERRRARLRRRLDDAHRVGDDVGDAGGDAAHQRGAQQPVRDRAAAALQFGQQLVERVEGEEPRVASHLSTAARADETITRRRPESPNNSWHKIGRRRRERAGPKLTGAVLLRAAQQQLIRAPPLHLKRRLERVERRDCHAPQRRRCARQRSAQRDG